MEMENSIFKDKMRLIAKELDDYYTKTPHDVSDVLSKIEELYKKSKTLSSYIQKALIHDAIVNHCEVHISRQLPFYFEMQAGRPRYSWGVDSPLGNFLKNKHFDKWINPYRKSIKELFDKNIIWGWNPVGFDHHCPGYDIILSKGLKNIIESAREQLEKTADIEQKEFLKAVIDSNRSLLKLAEKFSDKAREMAEAEVDEKIKNNLLKIAETAGKVPANPPESFYEALAGIIFIRENYGTLEGLGMSTFGQLDRLLLPYYERDINNGCFDRNEAKELIHCLLTLTDAKFGVSDTAYKETSTTIVIGGCDRNGTIICNDITRIIIEAYLENTYIGTKLNARISSKHPKEYAELLSRLLSSKSNILVIQNDDTLIKANVNRNKSLEDSRLYVSGGCHEMVLANTEVHTRADHWINLPQILLNTLFPNRPVQHLEAEEEYPDFDSFYRQCIRNVRIVHNVVADKKKQYEELWSKYDPYPLYSSSIEDCIKRAKDVAAGGARYNTVSLSMVGAATFIDSLYSIRELVYTDKKMSLSELRNMLDNNFSGHLDILSYIRKRIPKHGTDNEALNDFGRKVMEDLSATAGQRNGRGGFVVPAFYPHEFFRNFGAKTKATPDGRKDGDYLSRGFSPSEFVEVSSVTDILNSIKAFDLSLFPESFVTELTLPYSNNSGNTINILSAVIQNFVSSGGSTLQINILDKDILLKAKAEPEKYKFLVVRICGFSQPFNSLTEEMKDEVISRAIRNA